MARRRIWRNKPKAEKERRRKMAMEKAGNQELGNRKEKPVNPEIEARYRTLSPMMKETVDSLVSSGLSMEKVINGLRS
jgi:hypothetical protein